MAERAWDGKCARCRRLMSRCECFQAADDRQPAPEPTTMAADPRPLYNALRKMHRKTPSFLAQPPSSSNNNSNNPNDPRLRTKSHDVPPRASARSALKAASSLPTLPRAPPRLQAPRSRPPSTHGSSNNDVARGIYTASTPVKQVKQTPPAKPVELDDAVWEL